MKRLILWMKLVTVEPVLFFYMLLIFLESNSLQNLIYVKSCLKILNPVNASDCDVHNKKNATDDPILLEATDWTRYNSLFLFFSTLLSSFFVASWSDKFGRKFPMIIPPLGTLIAASINCVLSIFIHADVAYLFISSTVSGLTFGTVGIIASTFGFIADISDESSRTKRIMFLEAALYLGGTCGVYIAGGFLKHVDYDLQMNGFSKLFIFESSVALLIALYIMIRIPYRMDDREYPSFSCGNLFNLQHLKDSVKCVFRSRNSGKRKTILLLLLALFLIYFGLVVNFTLSYYYVEKLGWDFYQYSIFSGTQHGVEGGLLLAMPILIHFFHVNDHFIAILGIISKMAGFILFGLSHNSVMIMSCIALFAFSEYPVPPIRSMLSKIIDPDEKGRIFAFTTILQNCTFLIGSLTLTSIFRETVSFFPGLCFEVVAAMQFVALCIIIYLYVTREEVVTVYEVMHNVLALPSPATKLQYAEEHDFQ